MQVSFLGAAGMVTGSSYLIEADGKKILVDCGMFQGSKADRELNFIDFPYEPASIDCVLLTHAHIDHSGRLPRLCKMGFTGKIYTTKITADLCGIMLPDSGHIQEFDAEIANRKGKRAGKKPVEPLYTVDDAYNCLKQLYPVEFHSKINLTPNITVQFRDAGHILGSSMLEVWITEENNSEKLAFSGDLGQPNQPIIQDPEYIEEADYVIIESTYGNRNHVNYDKEAVLGKIINDTVKRGGNIVIPAFAVGRTQTILYYLHKLLKAGQIPDIPVIIDSPLAISATDIFMHHTEVYDSEALDIFNKEHDSPLKLPQLTFTKTAEESKALNFLDKPAIIISASGMADAGRILHHLKHNLWRPESSILFVGYQAQGSLGRRLLEGVKKVKIMGEEISVKATIYNLEGFSAHADQQELIDWLSHFKKSPSVFIVHGEHAAAAPFSALIQERLNYSTYIPQYGDRVVIEGTNWRLEKSIVEAKPDISKLREQLTKLEYEYENYRKHIEQLVAADGNKLPEAIAGLEKMQETIKKAINEPRR